MVLRRDSQTRGPHISIRTQEIENNISPWFLAAVTCISGQRPRKLKFLSIKDHTGYFVSFRSTGVIWIAIQWQPKLTNIDIALAGRWHHKYPRKESTLLRNSVKNYKLGKPKFAPLRTQQVHSGQQCWIPSHLKWTPEEGDRMWNNKRKERLGQQEFRFLDGRRRKSSTYFIAKENLGLGKD